jgi:hypothetical protein
LNFFKVAKLQQQKSANNSRDNEYDFASGSMHLFWKAIRDHRHMIIDYAEGEGK